MVWTQFWDMHSGGRTKEPPYDKIYIEAPIEEAKSIFYSRFGHNPERVSCTCCGEDYAIYEEKTLKESTKFQREDHWDGEKRKSLSMKEYIKLPTVLFIRKKDIKPEERKKTVPSQGYVWVG